MKITRLSSRAFDQDVGRAKRAADTGPVIITDQGAPAYVLMRHDAYKRLAGEDKSLIDQLYYPGADDVDFELPPRSDGTFRRIDLP